MALNPGTKLEPCNLLAPLGASGMGEVYRARDRRPERADDGITSQIRPSAYTVPCQKNEDSASSSGRGDRRICLSCLRWVLLGEGGLGDSLASGARGPAFKSRRAHHYLLEVRLIESADLVRR